jgi:hypothetical protein
VTLFPHADSVLSKRIALFGIPGSGKSNALTVFCEELGKLPVYDQAQKRWVEVGAPFILADTEGEYDALCSRRYLMRPFYAHAENVTPENAFDFGQQVPEQGLQVVLNLQSYADDNTAALVMIGLIGGLRAWAEAQESSDDRVSCMFILDEVAIWLPQNQGESILSKEKDDTGKTLLNYLHQAFFGTVVRRGRKRGIGFLFAGQRIAEVDKRCIQCDWSILFQQTAENDIERYASLGVPKVIPPALGKGEAFVIHEGRGRVHQFRRRVVPDHSQTPGLASLHKYAEQWAGHQRQAMLLPVLPPEPTQNAPRALENTKRVHDYYGYSTPMSHPAAPRRYKHHAPESARQVRAYGRPVSIRPPASHGASDGFVGGPQNAHEQSTQAPFELETAENGSTMSGPTVGRPQNSVNRPVEPLGVTPEQRPQTPRMDDQQVAEFIAKYPYIGSVDRTLDDIEGCNHRHRDHARELIRTYHLDEKRAQVKRSQK